MWNLLFSYLDARSPDIKALTWPCSQTSLASVHILPLIYLFTEDSRKQAEELEYGRELFTVKPLSTALQVAETKCDHRQAGATRQPLTWFSATSQGVGHQGSKDKTLMTSQWRASEGGIPTESVRADWFFPVQMYTTDLSEMSPAFSSEKIPK